MRAGQAAVALPFVAGTALLATVLLLLPGAREVATLSRRATPPSLPQPVPSQVASRPKSDIQAPALDDEIRQADAATLARVTDRYPGATTVQVARDLIAFGRRQIALEYLDRRADGTGPATWRLRADVLDALGRRQAAAALLAAAARAPGVAPVEDIVQVGYAIQRPDLIVVAIARGVVPATDRALVLDLVRRAEAAGRLDLIAMIDRAGARGWRRTDPWLALRVAQRHGDPRAELVAVQNLPAADRDAAREAILSRTGDRDGMRRLLLARGDTASGAEHLLDLGYRADAIGMLRRIAATLPATAPASRRLLYLLGPRPAPTERTWLRDRAFHPGGSDAAGWLRAYADRDAPAVALATVARHPLGGTADALLLRLRLARESGDRAAGEVALRALLSQPSVTPGDLQQASTLLPGGADPAIAALLTRRRIDAGVASPRDRLDLGWAALNRADAATARTMAAAMIADAPDNLDALRLMAAAQQRIGGDRAARPWLQRLLARFPDDGRDRAELLERLGRRQEALTMVTALRRAGPGEAALAAMEARLLIATGRPGAAQRLLAR